MSVFISGEESVLSAGKQQNSTLFFNQTYLQKEDTSAHNKWG